jgi:superkiller protein 3
MTNFKKNTLDAVSAFKSGKIIEAEILVKKLIEINPRVAFLYNLLGLILYKKKEINKALEAYEKGIEIDSNFANIYNNIGILLYNNKFNGYGELTYYKNINGMNKLSERYEGNFMEGKKHGFGKLSVFDCITDG